MALDNDGLAVRSLVTLPLMYTLIFRAWPTSTAVTSPQRYFAPVFHVFVATYVKEEMDDENKNIPA
jgi:hypothetical protein